MDNEFKKQINGELKEHSDLLAIFVKKFSKLTANEEKVDDALKNLKLVIEHLQNYVQKEELSKFLLGQTSLVNQKLEELETSTKKLSLSKNKELNDSVNRAIGKANLVVQKIEEESKLYKKKYFQDSLEYKAKYFSSDSEFQQTQKNILQDIKNLESLLDNKTTSNKELIFEKVTNLKNDLYKFEQSFLSYKENNNKDNKQLVLDIDNKISNLKEELLNVDQQSETELKNLFDNEFKNVKHEIESTDDKISNHNKKFKILENKTLNLIGEVKDIFTNKKFTKLNTKISFIEDTLEKFNEKSLLIEELVNQPSEKNEDPLTPLNQNFVTFDDLKKHYQLFINRVQQQLMSVGGGGAVRIDQLDDVDHNSIKNAQNGQALVFITVAEGGNNKFEARNVAATGGGGGGGGPATEIAEATVTGNIIPSVDNTFSLGNTTHRFANLFLSGNTLVIGGLTLRDRGDELDIRDKLDRKILRARPSAPVVDREDFTIANIQGYAANLDATLTTENVIEHTNLYFTDIRANAAIEANVLPRLTTANVVEHTNLYFTDSRFNTNFATKDTDDVSEGSTNEYFTQARARSSISKVDGAGAYNSGTGEISIPATTAHIAEVTDQYFSNARANIALASNLDVRVPILGRAALSTVAGARAYNSSTGVITIPGTSDDVSEGTTNLFFSNTRANGTISANVQHSMQQHMVVALSGSTDNVFASANVLVMRAPVPMTLYQLPRISVLEAPTGDTIEVGIQVNNSDILSTNLTIDANETTSTTAATPAVLSSTTIADDAEIQFDVNKVGSTLPGKALKLTLYYTVTEV